MFQWNMSSMVHSILWVHKYTDQIQACKETHPIVHLWYINASQSDFSVMAGPTPSPHLTGQHNDPHHVCISKLYI